MASRSARVAAAMTRSRILFLLQLHFRLGEPDVDRRDVAIPLAFAALFDLDRAPRAAERDVLALQELADRDHARFIYVTREMRRNDLDAVFEQRDVPLAASRII